FGVIFSCLATHATVTTTISSIERTGTWKMEVRTNAKTELASIEQQLAALSRPAPPRPVKTVREALAGTSVLGRVLPLEPSLREPPWADISLAEGACQRSPTSQLSSGRGCRQLMEHPSPSASCGQPTKLGAPSRAKSRFRSHGSPRP